MRRDAVVVGGGITGLAAAYELTKKDAGWDVTLLETSSRMGGKIISDAVGDLVFEGGPDSFLTSKPWALDLARELGLEPELMTTNDESKSVYVYTRGRLKRYPEGMMLMAPARILPFLTSDFLPWSAKARMGMEFLVRKGDPDTDESLAEFTRRRFGEEALHTIVGPIMAGIHAGDPERLSMRSTFPQFHEMERKHGSVIRGMRAALKSGTRAPRDGVTLFMTLRGGLGQLVDALWQRLPSGTVRLKSGLSRMEPTGDGRYNLKTEAGDTIRADAVILAVPASKASQLLNLDVVLSQELGGIQFASTAVAGLVYPYEALPEDKDGFGLVVDRREDRGLIAVGISSTKFPGRAPADKRLLRCFVGGAGREQAADAADEALLETVRSDLKDMLGIEEEPESSRLYRWPGASPQYNVGHAKRLERIEELLGEHPGLVLAGDSYRGTGIAESVRSGRDAARRIIEGDGPPSGCIV